MRRCRLPVFKTGAIDQLCQTSNVVTRERLELPTPTFVASCSDPTELTSQSAEAEGFEPSEPLSPQQTLKIKDLQNLYTNLYTKAPFLGLFLCNEKSPAITGLQHCTRCNSGLRNNVCCKITNNQGFFKIPARIFLIQLTIGVRFR